MVDPRDASLRAAVLANPKDDVVRLAYADFLDETAGVVVCKWCEGAGFLKCGFCGLKPDKKGRLGKHRADCPAGDDPRDARPCPNCHHGWASDGRAERAEFIRQQVHLASFDDAYYLSFDNQALCQRSAVPAVARTAELVHAAWGAELSSLSPKLSDITLYNAWEFRRGFPWRVVAPLRDLWGAKARLPFWRSLYPIERARPSDSAPVEVTQGVMFCRDIAHDAAWPWPGWGLPPDLFDRLTGFDAFRPGDGRHHRAAKDYRDRAAAMVALEEAVSHGLLPQAEVDG